MNPSQSLARPLLASMFIAGGIDSLRNSEAKVKEAEVVVKPLTQAVPSLPKDTEAFVRFNGAVQVGAGVLLATGKLRRLSALALIGSIIPTTYAGHRFWEESDDLSRKQQGIHFLKNMGLLGGLILELGSGPAKTRSGKNSRSEKRAKAVVRSGSATMAKKTAKETKHLEREAERRARAAAKSASVLASRTASDVAKRSRKAAKKSQVAAVKAAKKSQVVAGPYVAAATEHAGQLLSHAHDQIGHLAA